MTDLKWKDDPVKFAKEFARGHIGEEMIWDYRHAISEIIASESWRSKQDRHGDPFKSFGDFMEAPFPEGADTRFEFVEQLYKSYPAFLSQIKTAWGMQSREDAARSQLDAIMSRFGWQFIMSHLVKRCTATPLRSFLRGK